VPDLHGISREHYAVHVT